MQVYYQVPQNNPAEGTDPVCWDEGGVLVAREGIRKREGLFVLVELGNYLRMLCDSQQQESQPAEMRAVSQDLIGIQGKGFLVAVAYTGRPVPPMQGSLPQRFRI